jgi:hypothetical protein
MPHFITSCQKGRKKKDGKKPSNFVICRTISLILSRDEEAQATGRRANLGHLGYPADAALVLLVVLGTSEGVRHTRRTTEDWREGGSADVKFGKLVEFDVDRILRVALALSLDLLGL